MQVLFAIIFKRTPITDVGFSDTLVKQEVLKRLYPSLGQGPHSEGVFLVEWSPGGQWWSRYNDQDFTGL